jgi:hypothetical protein
MCQGMISGKDWQKEAFSEDIEEVLLVPSAEDNAGA